MACIDVNEPSDEWMMNFKGFETIEKYRKYMNSLTPQERNHQLHWGIYNFNGFLKEDHKCRSGQEVMNRWCRACKLVFRTTRSFEEHVKKFHRAPANDNFDLGKFCDFLREIKFHLVPYAIILGSIYQVENATRILSQSPGKIGSRGQNCVCSAFQLRTRKPENGPKNA